MGALSFSPLGMAAGKFAKWASVIESRPPRSAELLDLSALNSLVLWPGASVGTSAACEMDLVGTDSWHCHCSVRQFTDKETATLASALLLAPLPVLLSVNA